VTEPQLSTRVSAGHTLPSGLIHDLRTPLNLIIGCSEMLIEQAQEQGQDDFVPDLQKTLTAGKQLLAIINDNFRPSRALGTAAGITVQRKEPTPPIEEEPATEALPECAAADKVAFREAPEFLLVVDDIEANRDLLSRRLKNNGYLVATAENGRQALEMLRTANFDLVSLDVLMPEMDGYEVLQRLKADEILRHIPVIMMSALNELDSVVRCIEMGAEDYLGKPFNPTLLQARIGACLEKKHARETERELEAARQLLETSRQAGMTEIATNILHVVGNVLNSVNVSSDLILDKILKSKAIGFAKVANLLEEHKNDLPGFFEHNPIGRRLLGYLSKLNLNLAHEQEEILKEVHTLQSNILHFKKIVAMQQNFARVPGPVEMLNIEDLVEDSVRLTSGALERHGIKLVREYSETHPVLLDKHKVLQILVNLVRNAEHAFDVSEGKDKQITLRIVSENNRMKIAIIDNGVGIPAENLIRIFSQGFTTRKTDMVLVFIAGR
jgi:two-component system sensor histidine kinase ChiS